MEDLRSQHSRLLMHIPIFIVFFPLAYQRMLLATVQKQHLPALCRWKTILLYKLYIAESQHFFPTENLFKHSHICRLSGLLQVWGRKGGQQMLIFQDT